MYLIDGVDSTFRLYFCACLQNTQLEAALRIARDNMSTDDDGN